MKKAGLLFNARIEAARLLAEQLGKTLQQEGVSAWICPSSDEANAELQFPGTEMILSLGGDGTMLQVARLASTHAIPILGINMGTLGFTTELTGKEAIGRIGEFLVDGKAWIDERAMLQAEIDTPQRSLTLHALNDIVIGRGGILRVIKVTTSIDGQPITTYKGDGVIVATATGSTGYSLAAGGPILFPSAREFLLTPITPHLGLTAALVLSSQSMIELEVQTSHEARISIDGQVELPLQTGDVIKVSRSPLVTRLLRVQPRSFFHQTLLKRLSSKGD